MGVKTKLTLTQAQKLFPKKAFTNIEATKYGVIDTTYIARTKDDAFILKKYERASTAQIKDEQKLLEQLHKNSLPVPKPLESSQQWYLFTLLKGEIPHKISLQQLRSVGRFLAKFHSAVFKQSHSFTPFQRENYQKALSKLRKTNLYYSKRVAALNNFPTNHDGIIHGDLFCDNAKFDQAHLGVFDFIEAGNGSYAFDVGVVAMSWVAKKRLSRLQLDTLLKAYNQKIKKKITMHELLTMIEYAALVYSLKRFLNPLSPLDYKEMLDVERKVQRFKKLHFYHKKS